MATVLTVMLVGLAGGCASSALPPKITPEQRALVQRAKINVSIGVEDYSAPVYSDSLIQALDKTRLFGHVDHLSNFSTPSDYIARVEEGIYGTATIPIWTGLSLGIIPTTVDENHGYSFSLSRPGADAPRVPIEFKYRGSTTLGWWAVILNLLPDRTMRDVGDHPRFTEAFAWKIVTKQAEIEALKTK